MPTKKQKLLEESVVEITKLMRSGKAFKGVLRLVKEKGLDPQQVFLTDHYEDEDGNELGVIVTVDGACFEFKHDAYAKRPTAKWVRVRKLDRLFEKYILVEAAVTMVTRGRN